MTSPISAAIEKALRSVLCVRTYDGRERDTDGDLIDVDEALEALRAAIIEALGPLRGLEGPTRVTSLAFVGAPTLTVFVCNDDEQAVALATLIDEVTRG